MFQSACPIFPSSDFERTKGFYSKLGFEVGSEYPEHGYLILYQDKIELHFFRFAEHVATTSDHGAFLRVEDANVISKSYEVLNLPKEGIPRFIAAEDKEWGICELNIIDPDGNLLRFGHILEATN